MGGGSSQPTEKSARTKIQESQSPISGHHQQRYQTKAMTTMATTKLIFKSSPGLIERLQNSQNIDEKKEESMEVPQNQFQQLNSMATPHFAQKKMSHSIERSKPKHLQASRFSAQLLLHNQENKPSRMSRFLYNKNKTEGQALPQTPAMLFSSRIIDNLTSTFLEEYQSSSVLLNQQHSYVNYPNHSKSSIDETEEESDDDGISIKRFSAMVNHQGEFLQHKEQMSILPDDSVEGNRGQSSSHMYSNTASLGESSTLIRNFGSKKDGINPDDVDITDLIEEGCCHSPKAALSPQGEDFSLFPITKKIDAVITESDMSPSFRKWDVTCESFLSYPQVRSSINAQQPTIDQPNTPVARLRRIRRVYVRSEPSNSCGSSSSKHLKVGCEKPYKIEIIESQGEGNSSKARLATKDILYHCGVSAHSLQGNYSSENACNSGHSEYFVFTKNKVKLMCLLAGHGAHAESISNLTSRLLFKHSLKLIDMLRLSPDAGFKRLFANVDRFIQQHIIYFDMEEQFNCVLSGASCCYVMVEPSRIHVVSLGEANAYVFRQAFSHRGVIEKQNYIELSRKHNSMNKSERKRIHSNSGEFRKLANDQEDRIFVRGRIFPAINITRCFGNEIAKLIGVTSEPEVVTYEITRVSDQFLFIASPRFFDYRTSPQSHQVHSIVLGGPSP